MGGIKMSRALVQNLDLYLINEGQSWYLSDAGGFDSWLDPHATRIVQAVQAVIPPGQKLTYVICEPPFASLQTPWYFLCSLPQQACSAIMPTIQDTLMRCMRIGRIPIVFQYF